MGSRLNQLKAQVSTTAWLKPRDVAAAQIVFAIKTMENVAGNKFNRQWRLELELREDTIDPDIDTGIQPGQRVMVSLPAGDQRDRHFEQILSERLIPCYNCIFEIVFLETGNEYIDLVQLEDDDNRWMAPPAPKLNGIRKGTSSSVTFRSKSKGTSFIAPRQEQDPFMEGDDLP